jgi:hypothetical protein
VTPVFVVSRKVEQEDTEDQIQRYDGSDTKTNENNPVQHEEHRERFHERPHETAKVRDTAF